METIIAIVVNVGQLETYEYSNSQSQVKETGYSRDGNGWFGRTTMRRYAILAPDTFDAIPIYK